MEEMCTGNVTGMSVATHIKEKLGKDVGTERMHRGFLSDQQQLDYAPFSQVLLRTWHQN